MYKSVIKSHFQTRYAERYVANKLQLVHYTGIIIEKTTNFHAAFATLGTCMYINNKRTLKNSQIYFLKLAKINKTIIPPSLPRPPSSQSICKKKICEENKP